MMQSIFFHVTDIKQYVYCPRVIYYTYVMPVHKKVSFKMEYGREQHNELNKKEKRRGMRSYDLVGGERYFHFPVESRGLGLYGKLDMLIDTGNGKGKISDRGHGAAESVNASVNVVQTFSSDDEVAESVHSDADVAEIVHSDTNSNLTDPAGNVTQRYWPVEFKYTTQRIRPNITYQLAAYAMILEEMKGEPIEAGFIYTIPTKQAHKIVVTQEMRDYVRKAISAMTNIIEEESFPQPRSRRRCHDCEFRRYCNDIE